MTVSENAAGSLRHLAAVVVDQVGVVASLPVHPVPVAVDHLRRRALGGDDIPDPAAVQVPGDRHLLGAHPGARQRLDRGPDGRVDGRLGVVPAEPLGDHADPQPVGAPAQLDGVVRDADTRPADAGRARPARLSRPASAPRRRPCGPSARGDRWSARSGRPRCTAPARGSACARPLRSRQPGCGPIRRRFAGEERGRTWPPRIEQKRPVRFRLRRERRSCGRSSLKPRGFQPEEYPQRPSPGPLRLLDMFRDRRLPHPLSDPRG